MLVLCLCRSIPPRCIFMCGSTPVQSVERKGGRCYITTKVLVKCCIGSYNYAPTKILMNYSSFLLPCNCTDTMFHLLALLQCSHKVMLILCLSPKHVFACCVWTISLRKGSRHGKSLAFILFNYRSRVLIIKCFFHPHSCSDITQSNAYSMSTSHMCLCAGSTPCFFHQLNAKNADMKKALLSHDITTPEMWCEMNDMYSLTALFLWKSCVVTLWYTGNCKLLSILFFHRTTTQFKVAAFFHNKQAPNHYS